MHWLTTNGASFEQRFQKPQRATAIAWRNCSTGIPSPGSNCSSGGSPDAPPAPPAHCMVDPAIPLLPPVPIEPPLLLHDDASAIAAVAITARRYRALDMRGQRAATA